ncbi:MAG: APC family permease, partial [Planctomycetota bacterium]
MMGLGSILGTGVFVSIGIAAGVTGPSVVLAIVLAGGVALCNAFSSAQLAASHPVSGGTYEYGYKYLHSTAGFTAGWMFLCAKCASAATAALGFAGYLLALIGAAGGERWAIPLAAGATGLLTALVLGGIKRSNWVNTAIVAVTLVALASFVVVGAATAPAGARAHFSPFLAPVAGVKEANPAAPLHGLFYATALMFVAYTGYGRIATLGEEVREPRRTIPRAILATLAVSALLYVAVGVVAVATAGAPALAAAVQQKEVAPLTLVARGFAQPWVAPLVALGAMTAMLGVLLNLILGLSRIVLAMA